MNKKLLIFAPLVIVCVAVVAALLYFYPAKESVSQTTTFSDEQLGLSFNYPLKFGAVITSIAGPGKRPGGETGEKIALTFSEFSSLEIGGVTDDYTAGRELMITDTRGFLEENGKYYFKLFSGKGEKGYEIQPLKIIKKDFGEILILDDKSFAAERDGLEGPVFGVGAGRLAGLVNLKSIKFPGLVFYNWDTAKLSLEDFEVILNSSIVSKPSSETFTQTKGPINYSLNIPSGWFAHENGQSVIFTQEKDLNIPSNTEGYAIGSNFYITVNNITDIAGVTTYDDWLEKNGMTEKNELFISRENVVVNGYSMIRVQSEAAGATGKAISYVYFADIQRVITLTQFPYDQESNITKVFEGAVQTFRVPERQSAIIDCLPEQRNADVCADDYTPVCAMVEIQCIKAPCNPVEETFSNACNACKNPLVKSYIAGECLIKK
ncbi:MAG: hypothetical protein ABH830_04990 [Patescibacteria group bacterium]